MGPEVRGELGRLRVLDLLREAADQSKGCSTERSGRRSARGSDRRSTRRPSPRTGDEA